jgi:membrane associated rhomboid family serine protease
MKSEPYRLKTCTDIVLFALIVSFFVQAIFELFSLGFGYHKLFALNWTQLVNGYFWQVITYGLLHDGPLHLIFNLLGVHFAGRALEEIIGFERYLKLMLSGLFAGAVMWMAFSDHDNGLIGFSAAVLAILTLYCLKRPHTKVNLLLFFIIPISIRPQVILIGLLVLELYGFLFSELNTSGGIAHSAHLGGMLAAILLHLFSGDSSKLKIQFPKFIFSRGVRVPKSSQTPFSANKTRFKYKVNLTETKNLQQQVDKILDKINEKGFGALDQNEKNILEKAKGILKK